jgi:hypothetical protein
LAMFETSAWTAIAARRGARSWRCLIVATASLARRLSVE